MCLRSVGVVMARGHVRDIDMGWRKLRDQFKRTAQHNVVRVGIQGSEALADHDGINNVALAAVHEFGTMDGRIPERSFIRAAIDENQGKYRDFVRRIANRVVDRKMSVLNGLKVLGEKVVADMRARVRAGLEPDITEETKARKGSSKPLIDTGQMLGSITAVVGEGDRE